MKSLRMWSAAMIVAIACISLALVAITTHAYAQQTQPQAQPGQAQNQAPPSADSSTPVFKAETRLVLVDTVVTDKSGNYISGLTAKDFKVWEDDKEQPIKSFSAEAGAAAPSDSRRHYLVLLFDNSTMDFTDQARAREAAAKFVEANAGPDRYMAVMNFGGTLNVALNFTSDAQRLKQVVRGVKFSSVSPNGPQEVASLGAPQLGSTESSFGTRTLLLALRSIGKNLASVPGRKSLVLLTTGLALNPTDPEYLEQHSELMAVIDACNKANVAVYPIDVHGLSSGISAAPGSARLETIPDEPPARLVSATLDYSADDPPAHLVYVQRGSGGGHGGGGGTGGGGTGGGGSHGGGGGTGGGGTHGGGGTRGTGGGSASVNTPQLYTNPYNRAPSLVPIIPSVVASQQMLYQLAEGTGGFVIVNSNDLLGGMQKIAKEQTEYYVLGYAPPPSDEGACHTLKVKVERSGTISRWRTGYCNVKPTDLLAGKPESKQLENRINGSQPGTIAASMRAPFFYTSANTARVNLAIEIPPNTIKFVKQNGNFHASVNVAGIAYKLDGTAAARFSDTLSLTFDDKKAVEEFNSKPAHYETQFDIASGHYNLKVAFNPQGADSFGKMDVPLVIDAYDGKQFALSAVAFSKEIHPVSQVGATLDAALLEDRTPLVTQGLQLVPSGSDQFKKSDKAAFYVEIYDPLLTGATPPKVGIQLSVIDRKSGDKKMDTSFPAGDVKPGNALVPVGLKLPVDTLPPGSYRLELKAMDTAGNTSQPRTADFEVQ
jgi:VWFA-related protein